MPSGCRVDGVEIDSQNMRCARANTLSGLGLLALALALAASARFAASACAFVRLSPRAGDAWLSVSVSLSVSVVRETVERPLQAGLSRYIRSLWTPSLPHTRNNNLLVMLLLVTTSGLKN